MKQSVACPIDFLLKALDIVQKTDYTYKTSNNKRLHIEIALMQIASLNTATTSHFQRAPANTEAEKKKTDVTPVGYPKLVEQTPVAPSKISIPAAAEPSSAPIGPKPVPKTITQPGSTGKISYPGTISIKDDIVDTEDEKPVSEEVFDLESDEFLHSIEINNVELEEAWKEFAMTNTSDRPNFLSTLMATKPLIGKAFKNILQQQEIEDNKTELLRFLRDKLSNRFLRLKVIVNAEISTTKPYTPEEIHKYMVEKNPALNVMKQKFGLNLNY